MFSTDHSMNPSCWVIPLQAGIGYGGSYIINAVNQYLRPGKVILGVPPTLVITPLQSVICTIVFAILDRVAIKVFKQSQADHPAKQFLLKSATVILSAGISTLFCGISFQVATIAIMTNIVSMIVLFGAAKAYNYLVYNSDYTSHELMKYKT
jgi:hypothetical protein